MNGSFLPAGANLISRMAIIGVGDFGLRLLAYLWPRLRFQDLQRSQISIVSALREGESSATELFPGPNFPPRLFDLIAWVAIFSNPSHDPLAQQVVVASPAPQTWNQEVELLREICRGQERALNELDKREGFCGQHYLALEAGDNHRRDFWSAVLKEGEDLQRHLATLLEPALFDLAAPGQEEIRFDIYVVADLGDPLAAVVWPLGAMIRAQFGDRVPLCMTAILSTGIYPQSFRRAECGDVQDRVHREARAYAALCEFDYLASSDARIDWPERHVARFFVGRPVFEHVYVVDSEKLGGTYARNEEEIIVEIGNLLEAGVLSDVNGVLERKLGPDAANFWQEGRYGTFGTANVYIPVDEWLERQRYRWELHVLEESVLQDEGIDTAAIRSLAEKTFQLSDLFSTLLHGLPVVFQQSGVAAPTLVLQPEVLRVDYTVPAAERQQRLPYWVHPLWAAEHFAALGLEWDRQEIEAEFQSDMDSAEEAGLALETPFLDRLLHEHPAPRTQLEEWLAQARRNAGIPEDLQDVAGRPQEEGAATPLPVESSVPQRPERRSEAEGWLGDMRKGIRHNLVEMLLAHNNGVRWAANFLHELEHLLASRFQGLRDMARQDLFAEAGLRREEAQRRILYRRRLDSIPPVGGLLARTLVFATFIVFLFLEWLRHDKGLAFSGKAVVVPLAGIVLMSVVLSGVIHFYHIARLRSIRRAIERDMARRLQAQLTQRFALLAEEALAHLNGILLDYRDIVHCACGEWNDPPWPDERDLRARVRFLKEQLRVPLTLEVPVIRQSLSKLESLERQVIGEVQHPIPPLFEAGSPRQEEEIDGLLRWEERWVARWRQQSVQPGSMDKGAPTLDDFHEWEESTRRKEFPRLPYPSLAHFIRTAVERYVNATVYQRLPDQRIADILPYSWGSLRNRTTVEAPGHEVHERKTDPFDREVFFRAFLDNLWRCARPCLNWDTAQLSGDLGLETCILAVDEAERWNSLVAHPGKATLLLVSTGDRFGVTCLRLIHGLSARALVPFRRYQKAFRALQDQGVEDQVAIDPKWVQQGVYSRLGWDSNEEQV